MPLLLVSNPASGSGSGHLFVQEHVIPLLLKNGKVIDRLIVTDGPNSLGTQVLGFLKDCQPAKRCSLVVSGGDGTLHEIINAISVENESRRFVDSVVIALVPSGTANALYSSMFPPSETDLEDVTYKLKSVSAFLDGSSTKPLVLANTLLYGPGSPMPTRKILSAVVTSLALHAAILKDSEDLRATIPDMSRFKEAAIRNKDRWYNGVLRLLPTSGSSIGKYDHISGRFAEINHPGAEDELILQGPYAYFLSTVNVDRLEPKFMITPLHTLIPPDEPAMDIVIIRPTRDEGVLGTSINDRQKVSGDKLMQVMHHAYNEGAHIGIRFGEDGFLSTGGKGNFAVEYFRCGGWEWIPNEHGDVYNRIVCADGTIVETPERGKVECTILHYSSSGIPTLSLAV